MGALSPLARVGIAMAVVVALVVGAGITLVVVTMSQAGLDEVRAMAPANLELEHAWEVSRDETPESFSLFNSHHDRATIRIRYATDDVEAALQEIITQLDAEGWRAEQTISGNSAQLWGWREAGPWVADVGVVTVDGRPGIEIYVWMIVD